MEAIKKSDIIQGEPFNEIKQSINEAFQELERFDTTIKEAAASIAGLTKESKTTVTGINAITKAEIESEKLLKQKIQTEEQAQKLLIQKERLKQAAIRTEKAQQSTTTKTLSLYQQESRTLNELRNKYKDLAVQNKENTKEARALLQQITSLDTKLKGIDKTVGQSQRNVGNYGSALDNLKGKFGSLIGLASQFGLALGGAAIIKNSFNIIKDFEQGTANLASVLGKSRDEITALTEDAKRLGETTSFTASQVAQLQTELAKLGFSEQEILDATAGVQQFAAATGTDLARAAEVAGSTLRGFGLDATEMQKVVDVMAKSFSTSALDTEKFAESMKYVAPIAKAAGVSIEETTAMLGALANSGISGSSAGTALRQVLSQMDKTGKSTSEALADLSKEGLNLAGAEDEVGKNAKTALLVLLDQQKTVQDLTGQYSTAEGAAKKMADEQINTLGGAIALLTSAWEGFILRMNEASGAGGTLTTGIKFLADNLTTIMSVIGKLIKVWITYKATMAALKIRESALEWNNKRKAIASTGEAMQGASDKAKNFGNALKGIGLAVAINLAIELGMKLWDVASGAEAARNRMDLFNASMAKGTKFGTEYVATASDKLKADLQDLDLKRANSKMSEAMYLQEKKNIMENTALKVRTMKNLAIEDMRRAKENMQRLEAGYKAEREKNPLFQNQRIIAAYEVQRSAYVGLSKEVAEYTTFLKDVGSSVKDNTIAQAENTSRATTGAKTVKEATEKMIEAKRKETKAIEEQEKVYDSSKLLERMEISNELAQNGLAIRAEIAVLDAEIALARAKQAKDGRAIADAEIALKNAKIEQIRINEKIDTQNTDSGAEQAKINKQAELDILNLNDLEKDKVDVASNVQEAITQVLKDQIDQRIALLKQEEDAAKSQQEYLQGLAANGNITAKESIAEQIQLQRESQAEQARLERQKQNIELISAGLGTFNSQIEAGKSPGEALASTLASTQVLVGFLKNIQFFAKGTDNAPEGMAVVDEKGAEIITDKFGNIKDLGTGKGARFTHLNKGDKVITAEKTANILKAFGNVQNHKQIDKKKDVVGNSYDLLTLQALSRIEKAVKSSQSKTEIHWDTLGAVQRIKSNGVYTTNRLRK